MHLYFVYIVWAILFWYPFWFITKITKSDKVNPLLFIFILDFSFEFLKVVVAPEVCYPLNYFCYSDGIVNENQIAVVILSCIRMLAFNIVITIFLSFCDNYKPIVTLPYIEVKDIDLKMISYLFYLLFLLSLFILASSSFGVLSWLVSPREGYQFHREGAGVFFAAALSFLSLSFVFRLFIYKDSKQINSMVGCFLLYLISVYFLGSKGFILSFSVYFVSYLWFVRYKKLKRAFFISSICALILVLWNLISSLSSSVDFRFFVNYFDAYVNSAYIYESLSRGSLNFFEGDIFFGRLWELAPRIIFSDKPFVYGDLLVNEYMFPGSAELGHTPSFGGPIFDYADFGIVGVLLGSLMLTKLLHFYLIYAFMKFNSIGEISNNLMGVMLFSIAFAPSFLHYIPSMLAVMFFISCSILCFLTVYLRRRL
ncbi:hypothetical protein AB4125_20680 [Vibrio splendidus]